MAEFTHLHLHSQYSLLDGAIRLSDLFKTCKQYGMDSVALTDHGNMYGMVDFYKKAKDAGVKPIFGCETYVSATTMEDKTERKNYHLILLAKDMEGYKNLQFLNSKAFLEGFYYHPRIDKKLLKDHSRGLIGLSACLGGEVAQTLMREGYDKAKDKALEYKSLFEDDSFYLEVQPNGLDEQEQVNDSWKKMSRETGLGLVATGDCHYVKREDWKAHNILMCIQQGKTLNDPGRLEHRTPAYYIQPPDEFNKKFGDIPEALENTVKIASRCNVELELGKTYLPKYKVPEGYDIDSYMRKVAADGLERRFAEKAAKGDKFDPDQYRERLRIELDVIVKMTFAGYFLIVWDFINYAKEHGIPVGPGRGSGAGSIVAWSMRITDLDPIPYNLLFERFLNPERVSMPDFDVDFCMNRRGEVIKYVTEKYGTTQVGQIVTMHQLKSRGVIRDIARVMSIPYAEADKVAKLVPEPVQGKAPTIDEALEAEPKLRELYADEKGPYKELIEHARALEGLNRHAGMHAAGIVIGEKPLWEYVPCSRGPEGEIVTQFAKDEVEQAGLVKFDFLGLTTLTIIDIAMGLIHKEKPELDINTVPLDDASVYDMMTAGDTVGVFQIESSGFTELVKKLKPDRFEDIIALGALYRPGPLEGGMVDDFVNRKHGRTKVTYAHPALEPILKDTYGVIVYQEQVMQISSALAGYSLGQADLLRRAMGKKKKEVMEKEKGKFLAGAEKKGIDQKIADETFELMSKFAAYGFNKSHSAAYGLLTYQTGYLKRYWPEEFFAGVLTCGKEDTDKVVKNVAEVRAHGIDVLKPDVNLSLMDFSVVKEGNKKVIRFGLSAVKGVGEGAVESILAAREKDGPFKDVFDFCLRIDLKRVNKKVLEALVKSGAFDTLHPQQNRAAMLAAIDVAVDEAQKVARERESGQGNLFGGFASPTAAPQAVTAAHLKYADVDEFTPKMRLGFEKESLGFYITGHPLDRYQADLKRFRATKTPDIQEKEDWEEVQVGGIVSSYKEWPLKSGEGRMCVFSLEDTYGTVRVACFAKAFAAFEQVLKSDEPILVTGKVKPGRMDESDENAKATKELNLADAVPLAKLRAEKTKQMTVELPADALTEERIDALKAALEKYPGNVTTVLRLKVPMRSVTDCVLPARFNVTPSDELLVRIEKLFGADAARLR
ncbi:MAG TPA: DNA polymerase III subunit alpha [Polyangia bacterium]|nr:DNA polymerase III subunit alpha [Polyangia bacterium]